MSAESVSDAIERAADALRANAYLDPDGDAAAHGAERLRFMLAHLLDSPEGRRALLDVLQPTPEEVGGERLIEQWIITDGDHTGGPVGPFATEDAAHVEYQRNQPSNKQHPYLAAPAIARLLRPATGEFVWRFPSERDG